MNKNGFAVWLIILILAIFVGLMIYLVRDYIAEGKKEQKNLKQIELKDQSDTYLNGDTSSVEETEAVDEEQIDDTYNNSRVSEPYQGDGTEPLDPSDPNAQLDPDDFPDSEPIDMEYKDPI